MENTTTNKQSPDHSDAQASLRGLYPPDTESGAKLPLDESEGNPNA